MSTLRFPLLLSIFVVLVCVSGPTRADMNIGAGAKFGWDNYKRAVLDYSVIDLESANTGTGGQTLADYPSPRFGGNLQLNINRRIVTMLELDFGTFKHTVYPYPYDYSEDELAEIVQITQKFFKLGIGLEGKFFLTKPTDKKASPYVFLGLGKCFAKAKAPYAGTTLASSKVMSKLMSPFYLNLGFGAEFFINDSFSLGADIFGFRLETAKASVGQGGEYDNPYYTGDQSIMNLYMYTALTLNFTFIKDPSSEPAAPASSDVWGTGGTQDSSGWGAGADASGGWGTPAQPAPANNSWGTPVQPAPANNGWGTPATSAQPAPATNSWGTPDAAVAPAQPVQPDAGPAANKPKKKKKVGASVNVGGGSAPPPPAP
ncbi:MAG: outer membrane beta-barrel protein [Deltaproteobacteria bacterium]|nr:outer membrane beta-barrel protein [Deltaproteobacteria bacterium]